MATHGLGSWEGPHSGGGAWAELLRVEWSLSDDKQVNGISGGGKSTLQRYYREKNCNSGIRSVSSVRVMVVCCTL